MLRFRPDVKPQMWGPMSAVQYSVRVNAERMGIDPSKFVQYLPVWERGGVRLLDIFGKPDYVVGTDVANYTWSVWGLDRTGGFLNPSSGLAKPAIVGGRFTILQEFTPSVTYTRFYLSNRSEFGFQVQNATLSVTSYLRASSANVITSTKSHITGQKISAAMSWDGATFTAYSDGKIDGTTTPVSPAELQSGAMSLLGNEFNTGAVGSVGSYIHIADILTAAQIAHLNYEPYILLMPVTRPVYFDLGATENKTGVLAITNDSSLGLGGIKGALGSASFTAAAAFSPAGVKAANGYVSFSSASEFGVSGILEQSDDKIGAVVFVNESIVGTSGVKNALGGFGISHAAEVGVSGVKGVLMPELSQASGAAVSSREISGSVYTNKNTGILYAVATLSSTKPSVAQIQAGQNHLGAAAPYATSQSVSTYGLQSVAADGLTYNTPYYWHFQHKDGGDIDSTVITSAAVQTLDATVALDFPDTAPCSLLGYQVWSKLAVTDEEIAALWSE